ncbi:MAG: hypothetical protein ACOXZV_03700 [Bacteroidales bacterium]|jgi:hypothetical protein
MRQVTKTLLFLAFFFMKGYYLNASTDIKNETVRKALTSKDIQAFTGVAAANKIKDKEQREAYLLNYKQLEINYGNNVDFQLRKEQVILCPETVDYLYSKFTPIHTKYKKGTRPQLEKIVLNITSQCRTDREKVLAITRFCRDLYKKNPDVYSADYQFTDYVYGGTEEQLIDKPEILCETLGRLMVALCEICSIPGRIVMHDIGGHICSEIYVDNHWAYIDPRSGIYFLKKDGSFASVRDLLQDPSIIYMQDQNVKSDISDLWTWEYRAAKCEKMFFNPGEITGFQNYSLTDAGKYNYSQLTAKEVRDAGLFTINKQYNDICFKIFGLASDWEESHWGNRSLKKIPLVYRHDGFTMYFTDFLMDRDYLVKNYVDCFENSNVEIIEWGLGPGSVFCYETKVGQIFGNGLTNSQLSMLREGDRWVNKNVNHLIEQGGPLRIAVERAHQLGFDIFARLEMNHEYGPADPNNWNWVGFVGKFNKKHPEYRIPGTVLLDFKHEEVRDFKKTILREAAELGVDGISMDFAVYPPFFEKPDTIIMTRFVRDIREMLDEVGKHQNRRIRLMVRVPFERYQGIGLNWKTWAKEKLVDIVVPTHYSPSSNFDIPVEEFVNVAKETGVLIYPTTWLALGFVDTDSRPEDDKTGQKRYDKPKTREMFYAQALLFHRVGLDGLQLAFSADDWNDKTWLNELADPEKVEYANKHYMVDPVKITPGIFQLSKKDTWYCGERVFPLRIGDNIPEARKKGYEVTSHLVLYMRNLKPDEKMEIYVNGNGPMVITGSEDESRKNHETVIDPGTTDHSTFLFEKDWWQRGKRQVPINEDWWKLENNEIRIVYSAEAEKIENPISITWIDLLLSYREKE